MLWSTVVIRVTATGRRWSAPSTVAWRAFVARQVSPLGSRRGGLSRRGTVVSSRWTTIGRSIVAVMMVRPVRNCSVGRLVGGLKPRHEPHLETLKTSQRRYTHDRWGSCHSENEGREGKDVRETHGGGDESGGATK